MPELRGYTALVAHPDGNELCVYWLAQVIERVVRDSLWAEVGTNYSFSYRSE